MAAFDRSTVLWGVSCAGFGIVFTILFSKFVDSYTKQSETQNQILLKITGIEAQMIMADFPSLRTDLEKLKAEGERIKAKHQEEIGALNKKIEIIQFQIDGLKNEKS